MMPYIYSSALSSIYVSNFQTVIFLLFFTLFFIFFDRISKIFGLKLKKNNILLRVLRYIGYFIVILLAVLALIELLF